MLISKAQAKQVATCDLGSTTKIVIKTNIFMALLCARHCVGTKDEEMRNIIPAFEEFPVQSGRISQHDNYIPRQRHGKC